MKKPIDAQLVIVPTCGAVAWIVGYIMAGGGFWMRFAVANLCFSGVMLVASFINIARMGRIGR